MSDVNLQRLMLISLRKLQLDGGGCAKKTGSGVMQSSPPSMPQQLPSAARGPHVGRSPVCMRDRLLIAHVLLKARDVYLALTRTSSSAASAGGVNGSTASNGRGSEAAATKDRPTAVNADENIKERLSRRRKRKRSTQCVDDDVAADATVDESDVIAATPLLKIRRRSTDFGLSGDNEDRHEDDEAPKRRMTVSSCDGIDVDDSNWTTGSVASDRHCDIASTLPSLHGLSDGLLLSRYEEPRVQRGSDLVTLPRMMTSVDTITMNCCVDTVHSQRAIAIPTTVALLTTCSVN